jgi:hypothetical protein
VLPKDSVYVDPWVELPAKVFQEAEDVVEVRAFAVFGPFLLQ